MGLDGSASKEAGGLAGSSTQRVSATPLPEEPSSALSVRCTALVYQPFWPLGFAGSSAAWVLGAFVSSFTAVTVMLTVPWSVPPRPSETV